MKTKNKNVRKRIMNEDGKADLLQQRFFFNFLNDNELFLNCSASGFSSLTFNVTFSGCTTCIAVFCLLQWKPLTQINSKTQTLHSAFIARNCDFCFLLFVHIVVPHYDYYTEINECLSEVFMCVKYNNDYFICGNNFNLIKFTKSYNF